MLPRELTCFYLVQNDHVPHSRSCGTTFKVLTRLVWREEGVEGSGTRARKKFEATPIVSSKKGLFLIFSSALYVVE